jgi:hypothetical protein
VGSSPGGSSLLALLPVGEMNDGNETAFLDFFKIQSLVVFVFSLLGCTLNAFVGLDERERTNKKGDS